MEGGCSLPSFPGYVRARRHKALPERLPLLQGIKELPSTRPTCLLQHASWPPPMSRNEDFHPPRLSPHCARVPGPPEFHSQGGGPREASNWPITGRDCTVGPPPPLPGSRLHVSVFGYVRPPRGWEHKPWGAPGLGSGGEEPPC